MTKQTDGLKSQQHTLKSQQHTDITFLGVGLGAATLGAGALAANAGLPESFLGAGFAVTATAGAGAGLEGIVTGAATEAACAESQYTSGRHRTAHRQGYSFDYVRKQAR